VDDTNRAALIGRLQFFGQMASTETALFHQVAAAKVGLGVTDLKTISTLLQEGEMTAGQLSQRLNLTTGAITSVINRLEQRGIVERVTDPSDRRKVIVAVRRESLAPLDEVYRSMGDDFGELVETYSTEELAFLARFYEASIELTKREIARLKE
jgi:DNA-binding MarR family transcriptional regulator